MKIDLIKQALLEIKQEDMKSLVDIAEKKEIIESIMIRYNRELKEAKTAFNQLKFLDDTRNNTFKKLHMLLAIPEILIVVFTIIANFMLPLSVGMSVLLILLLLPSLIDLTYLHEFVYKKIDNSNNIFKRIGNWIKKCSYNDVELKKGLEHLSTLIAVIEGQKERLKIEGEDLKQSSDSINAEINAIKKDLLNINIMLGDGIVDVPSVDIPQVSPIYADKAKRLKP